MGTCASPRAGRGSSRDFAPPSHRSADIPIFRNSRRSGMLFSPARRTTNLALRLPAQVHYGLRKAFDPVVGQRNLLRLWSDANPHTLTRCLCFADLVLPDCNGTSFVPEYQLRCLARWASPKMRFFSRQFRLPWNDGPALFGIECLPPRSPGFRCRGSRCPYRGARSKRRRACYLRYSCSRPSPISLPSRRRVLARCPPSGSCG